MTSMNTVNHGGTRVYEGMTHQFDEATDLKSQIQDQRDAIDNSNLTDAQKALAHSRLDKAEESINDALDLTTQSGKYDISGGNTVGDGDVGAVLEALNNASDMLFDTLGMIASAPTTPPPSNDNSGTVQGSSPTDTTNDTQGVDATGGSGSTDQTSGTAQTDAAGQAGGADAAGQAGGADPADPKGAADAPTMTSAEAIALFESDPDELMERMEGLTSSQQQNLQNQIQQHLQKMNQMFSMMSNIAKSMHDTSKAIINNFRV